MSTSRSTPGPAPVLDATPRIPWEDRPAGSTAVLWRSSRNPIIPRDLLPRSNSIFNSAVVPFRDGYAGVFRAFNLDGRAGGDKAGCHFGKILH